MEMRLLGHATRSPLGLVVVLEKLAEGRLVRVVAVEDRVQHARGCVDLVNGRLEVVRLGMRVSLLERVLVVDPAAKASKTA